MFALFKSSCIFTGLKQNTMNIELIEVTFSDKSKAKYLIINHPNGTTGKIKILVKQWKELKKIGVRSEEVKINATNKF